MKRRIDGADRTYSMSITTSTREQSLKQSRWTRHSWQRRSPRQFQRVPSRNTNISDHTTRQKQIRVTQHHNTYPEQPLRSLDNACVKFCDVWVTMGLSGSCFCTHIHIYYTLTIWMLEIFKKHCFKTGNYIFSCSVPVGNINLRFPICFSFLEKFLSRSRIPQFANDNVLLAH